MASSCVPAGYRTAAGPATREAYRLRCLPGSPRVPVALRPAWERIGGLSAPSKMPGTSWSLPGGEACALGRALGCAGYCYAGVGQYTTASTRLACARRLASLGGDLSSWVSAMAAILAWAFEQGVEHHRWHDSGDVQSPEHLEAILEVARQVPQMRFWLPTQAHAWVRRAVAAGKVPANITVRLSARPHQAAPDDMPASAVSWDGSLPEGASRCQATEGRCGACRACWSGDVRLVVYPGR